MLDSTVLRVFRTGTWLTVHRALDILKLFGDPMGGYPSAPIGDLDHLFEDLDAKKIRHAIDVLMKI